MYEAHITYDGVYSSLIQDLLNKYNGSDWKFSKIDGDPVLGDGIKCYLSAHTKKYSVLMEDMQFIAGWFAGQNIPYIRMKIEKIIYDERV